VQETVIVALFSRTNGPKKYDAGRRESGRGIAKWKKIRFGLQPAKAKIMDMTLIQTERM